MLLKLKYTALAVLLAALTAIPAFPVQYASAAQPASGQGKTVTTKVTSETMIYDSDAGKVTFSKNVHVTHPDFTLNSNKLDLYLAKSETSGKSGGSLGGMDAGKVERIIALENVRIKLPEGRTATCAKATYMVRTEVLKMEGNPVLREDGNQLSADIIYFYFTENRSQAEGNVKVDFTSKENSSPAGGRSGGASGPTGQSGQTGQAAGAGN